MPLGTILLQSLGLVRVIVVVPCLRNLFSPPIQPHYFDVLSFDDYDDKGLYHIVTQPPCLMRVSLGSVLIRSPQCGFRVWNCLSQWDTICEDEQSISSTLWTLFDSPVHQNGSLFSIVLNPPTNRVRYALALKTEIAWVAFYHPFLILARYVFGPKNYRFAVDRGPCSNRGINHSKVVIRRW